MKTPMQDLKIHIQNMVDNGGDMDLLCVIGLIDSQFIKKEKLVIMEAFVEGITTALTEEPIFLSIKYYKETYGKEESN